MLKKLLCFSTLLFISALKAAEPAEAPPPPTKEVPQPANPESEQKWGEPLLPEETPPSSPSYEGAFMKMLLTLLGLLILIFLTFWLFRRMAHGRLKAMNFNRDIKILERRPLSAKSMLYLIEIKGKCLLIAESQLEVRTLTTIEEVSSESE